MKIGINEKRLVLRLSTLITALYAIEPTREIISGITSFKVGPVSVITICGVLTVIFVLGHFKKWW